MNYDDLVRRGRITAESLKLDDSHIASRNVSEPCDAIERLQAELAETNRFYIDSEFDGHGGPLLSLAIVPEHGTGLHITVDDAPFPKDPWVAENVLPIINSHAACNAAAIPLLDVGEMLRGVIGDRPSTIIADSPVDIGRFCEAISTDRNGSWHSFGVPFIRFEVHNIDCWPNDIPGAVQHNAWWDAVALRQRLAAIRERTDNAGR